MRRRPRGAAHRLSRQETDEERARAAGFDAHLVKPIAIEALEAVIRRLLDPAVA